MDPSVYDFQDKIKRFVEPVRRHFVCMLICSGVVFAVLYVGISLAELGEQNSEDLFILGQEILCESGCDFSGSADQHREMLNTYVKYMKGKHLAGLARLFFNEYSPEKGLADALTILSKDELDPQETARAIWSAGEQVMIFRMNATPLPHMRIALHEHVKIPKWLLVDISNALEQCKAALKQFEKDRTFKNATAVCEANRRAMLLLFLARSSYNAQQSLFDDFRKIVKSSEMGTEGLSIEFSEGDPQKELLMIFAGSEQRRLGILEAMSNDMRTAHNLMWQAIEESYHLRTKVLYLASKLCPAEPLAD